MLWEEEMGLGCGTVLIRDNVSFFSTCVFAVNEWRLMGVCERVTYNFRCVTGICTTICQHIFLKYVLCVCVHYSQAKAPVCSGSNCLWHCLVCLNSHGPRLSGPFIKGGEHTMSKGATWSPGGSLVRARYCGWQTISIYTCTHTHTHTNNLATTWGSRTTLMSILKQDYQQNSVIEDVCFGVLSGHKELKTIIFLLLSTQNWVLGQFHKHMMLQHVAVCSPAGTFTSTR